VSKECLGRLETLERLRTASATVAEEALAEKTENPKQNHKPLGFRIQQNS
jgi:hypothetical protein